MDPKAKVSVNDKQRCKADDLSLHETIAALQFVIEDLRYFQACCPNATGYQQAMFMKGYFATNKVVRVRN